MGIKICPECGGKVSESRNTCIHCGYVFPTTKKCPDCEADVDINAKECPECGHYFEMPEEQKNTGGANIGVIPIPVPAPETNNKIKKTSVSTKEEKHNHDNNGNKITNVTCSSCGSNDCVKLDDYTYRCNNCSSIIKLKKPDVNVFNINSFISETSSTEIPIYQVKKDLDEEAFVRKVVLYLTNEGNVSPLFLENLKIDKSMISVAYLTYVAKEYNVNLSYSCEVGYDYEVTYYENGKEQTKTETEWKPFSGTGTDGGTTVFCAYGQETSIDSLIPLFLEDQYDFEEFKEAEKYPLKRRADKSCDDSAKRWQIICLSSSCESNLPGDHKRNFKYNGQCTLSDIIAYYYVPAFSSVLFSGDHKIFIDSVANKKGIISHKFEESVKDANAGDEIMPDIDKAKSEFASTIAGKLFIAALACLVFFLGSSVVLAYVFGSLLLGLSSLFYICGIIAVCLIRKKTIDKLLSNLESEFRTKKLNACIACLASNNLEPLTEKEKESFTKLCSMD